MGTLSSARSLTMLLTLLLSSMDIVAADQINYYSARKLEVGDFDDVNKFLQDVEILIPDTTIDTQILGSTLTLTLSNIVCSSMNVGDIEIEWVPLFPKELQTTLNLVQANIDCSADFGYEYILGMNGGGSADILTRNNNASATFLFQSEDFQQYPPTKFAKESCQAEIGIEDINLGGGVLANIINGIESLARGTIETKIEEFLCGYLSEIEGSVNEMLQKFNTVLTPYMEMSEISSSPPLLAEETMERPQDGTLLDYQNPENSYEHVIDQAINAANQIITKKMDDGSLAINDALSSMVLESDGSLNIDLSSSSGVADGGNIALDTIFGTVNLDIQSVRIFGLNSFTRFDPIQATGKHTFQTAVSLENLRVEMTAEVVIQAPASAAAVDSSYANSFAETVRIEVGLDPIQVSIALLVAITENDLGGMMLGSLLDIDNILPCILSAVHELQVASLETNSFNIQKPIVSGLKSPGLNRILVDAIDIGFAMYGPALSKAIPGVLKTAANELLGGESGWHSECPGVMEYENDKFVDFTKLFGPLEPSQLQVTKKSTQPYGELPSMLKKMLDSELLAIDSEGLAKINDILIAPFTENQSSVRGRLDFPEDLFNKDTRIQVGGLDAQVHIRVNDMFIDNLDTVGAPLALLDPVSGSPHQLNNSASIGIGRPLRFGFRFLFKLSGGGTEIFNDFGINLDVSTFTTVLRALFRVIESRFLGFPLRDITNSDCLLAMMPAPPLDAHGIRLENSEPSFSLVDLAMYVARLNLNVTCYECSSSGMVEFAELLSTPQASDGATEVGNKILDYATDVVKGGFLETMVDRMLHDAKKKCPHSPEYDTNFVAYEYEPLEIPSVANDSLSFFITVLIAAGCLAIFVSAIMLTIRCIVRRRHYRWVQSLTRSRVYIISKIQKKEQDKISHANESTRSMFASLAIPWWIRWSMPLIILGNIGLFLSGHLSLAATVSINANLADQAFTADQFFEFSMARSTIDIWNAGGKELAVLILLFSGVWPYTKQLITLVLWFLPPKCVGVSKRGSIFLWLDVLAKWSMVDIFVLVVTVSAFRVSVQSPNLRFLPSNFYNLDLLVIPMWGLYANMIAQLVSQITSHFIIYYHRRIVADATSDYHKMHTPPFSENVVSEITGDIENDVELPTIGQSLHQSEDFKDKLSMHVFSRPHRGESEKLAARRFASPVVAIVAFSLSIFIIAGCSMPSFSLNVLGIVGVMVESGQEFEQAFKEYSLFTMIKLLFDQATFTGAISDYIGLGSLSILLILTVMIVPLVQSGILVYHWFVPMLRRKRERLFILVEILQAWQYLEVYILALIVGSWQLGPVSEYMINEYCAGMGETFSNLVYYGILSAEDAQCFRVDVKIEAGAFVLVVAAILLALLNTFVMKAVRQYFRDKDMEKEGWCNEKLEESTLEAASEMDEEKARNSIQPVPVLFTDTFRWFLYRDDTHIIYCTDTVELFKSARKDEKYGPESENMQDIDISNSSNEEP